MQHHGRLLELAQELLPRAYTPYSGGPEAAVVLLADGMLVPGVRVENASFSLTIHAATSAVTGAAALGRRDIVAVAVWPNPPQTIAAYLTSLPFARLVRRGEEPVFVTANPAPVDVKSWLQPPPHGTGDSSIWIQHARNLHDRAVVQESRFPVGCIVVSKDGAAIPGVNVEHGDWSHTLCAERVALSSARAHGYGPITEIYLSCRNSKACTPCGACRQVIAELAPEAVLWMDRGSSSPERVLPSTLLPDGFYLSLPSAGKSSTERDTL